MDALIAYLQMLRHVVDFKLYNEKSKSSAEKVRR